jgi:hypothetical protein
MDSAHNPRLESRGNLVKPTRYSQMVSAHRKTGCSDLFPFFIHCPMGPKRDWQQVTKLNVDKCNIRFRRAVIRLTRLEL